MCGTETQPAISLSDTGQQITDRFYDRETEAILFTEAKGSDMGETERWEISRGLTSNRWQASLIFGAEP